MGIGVISPHGQRQVQMAEEAQTTELPADGPWSKGWAEVSKAAGNFSEAVETAVSGVKDAVASVKLPWESSADELAAQTKNVRPPLPDLPKSQQNAPMGFQSLFSRLVDTESAGQHTNASGALLTSSKGAKGITQVMPKTAANPGFGVTPIQDNSAQEYLRFGKDYLSALIKNYGGDQTKAVAAYNYGPGAVDRAVAKAEKKGGDWLSFTPAETQKYVQKILGNVLAVATGSSNANAAADFSPYLKATNKTVTSPTYDKKAMSVTETNGIGARVVDIIKKDFPDHIDAINTKITGDKPTDTADAEYTPFNDKIALGKLGGSLTKWVDNKTGKVTTNTTGDDNQTNAMLLTTLHEIQHARVAQVGNFAAGLGKDWKGLLDDVTGKLPSINPASKGYNGDQLNEYLATATSVKEMARKGYPVPKEYADTISAAEKKYPWLKQWTINYINPEAFATARNKSEVEAAQLEAMKGLK